MEQNTKKNKIIILGRTNVGKSTFFNVVLNKEISIVSKKKNTTIRALEVFYKIGKNFFDFIDLPGPIIRVNDKNNVNKIIYNFINDSDLILFILDIRKINSEDFFLLELIKKYNKRAFLIINKVDKVFFKKLILNFINKFKNLFVFEKIIPISCKDGSNLDSLKKEIGFFLKDVNILIKNKDFLFKDIIRQALLINLDKELSYDIHFDFFIEKSIFFKDIMNIKLFVKKSSQKKIIIGFNGFKIHSIIKFIKNKLKNLYKKKYFIKIFVQKR